MPDPLDLARCRALCGEAEARAELRLTTASQVREVTTALRAACDEVERLREALAPFAHPDLCRLTAGNRQGDHSPVFGRDKATLRLGDFRRASNALESP